MTTHSAKQKLIELFVCRDPECKVIVEFRSPDAMVGRVVDGQPYDAHDYRFFDKVPLVSLAQKMFGPLHQDAQIASNFNFGERLYRAHSGRLDG